ncbi:MAG TPA: Holliday junction branch migration protein RuvA [Gammaproteobacteria bacterium]|nr:Holliday junction branch migration protein RuvA [Gammaproteobacteria bacterium]HAU07091.1 Holliday junction branch migration protein RuvA [Gammaproteobacteria bacterium]
MIGYLQGKILTKQMPDIMIDVQGVGYEVATPMSTYAQLGEINDEVALFIHMVVREDAQTLYGFHSTKERLLFRSLLKVNGVGAKLALAILSGSDVDSFAKTIEQGDAAALTRLPGVGKKTAERLVIEMRDKLTAMGSILTPAVAVQGLNASSEAIEALLALGYKVNEAEKMVKAVAQEGLSTTALIRQALQQH